MLIKKLFQRFTDFQNVRSLHTLGLVVEVDPSYFDGFQMFNNFSSDRTSNSRDF